MARAAQILFLLGIALLATGLLMVGGIVPQSTTGFASSGCVPSATTGCPSIVVDFATVTGQPMNSTVLLFNAATLTDHTHVGNVQVTSFIVSWGDGSPVQNYGSRAGFTATHSYPMKNANYTITETATGAYVFQPTGPQCNVIAGGCPSQTLAVTSVASHAIVIGSGSSKGPGPGCLASACPTVVANMSLSASGLNVTAHDDSIASNVCASGPEAASATIEWGDGSSSPVAIGGSVAHAYASPATYQVRESVVGYYSVIGPPSSCTGLGAVGYLASNVTLPVTVSIAGSSGTSSDLVGFGPQVGLTDVSAGVLIAGIVLLAAAALVEVPGRAGASFLVLLLAGVPIAVIVAFVSGLL